MGKNEDQTYIHQNLPRHKRIMKPIGLSQIGDGQITPISAHKILLNKPHFLEDNKTKGKDSYQLKQGQQNESLSSRKALLDITNYSASKSINAKKADKTKHTRQFTYLTFLDKTASRQYRVYLYVDRELGIPNEYAHKLMDHTVDNDVATDDEQIQNATRKLRGALEEEVFRKKELEEELLEYLTFVEIEKWEADAPSREQAERQRSIREFQMLLKNEKIAEQKNPIEPLIEKIFLSYQRSCIQPLRIKSHERLLYKSLEKSIPKFMDSFRNKSATYRNFLMRRHTIEAQQAQRALSRSSGSSNQTSMISCEVLSDIKGSGSDIQGSL